VNNLRETLRGVDLRKLFDRVFDTETMRLALGARLDYVRDSTKIVVETTGRKSAYGSAWGWWMKEAHEAATDHRLNRDIARTYPSIDEPSPLPVKSPEAYSTGRESTIIMRSVCRDREQVIKTMLHEIVHLVPVSFRGSRIPFHGSEFYRILAALLDELYPESGALDVYRARRWRMYAYDREMVGRFRDRGINYLPGEAPRLAPKPEPFVPTSIPSAGLLPSGAYVCDLADALDVAALAESAGWTDEFFRTSRKATLRREALDLVALFATALDYRRKLLGPESESPERRSLSALGMQ
jgi:hypothetical protein